MEIIEVISLLFLGGSFLIALLAYIDRIYKRYNKKCKYTHFLIVKK